MMYTSKEWLEEVKQMYYHFNCHHPKVSCNGVKVFKKLYNFFQIYQIAEA